MDNFINLLNGTESLDDHVLKIHSFYINNNMCPFKFDTGGITTTSTNLGTLAKLNVETFDGKKIIISETSYIPCIIDFNEEVKRKVKTPAAGRDYWYRNIYKVPDNVILKILIRKQGVKFTSPHFSAVIYLATHQDAPLQKISLKERLKINPIVEGRFEILQIDELVRRGVKPPISESSIMTEQHAKQALLIEEIIPGNKKPETVVTQNLIINDVEHEIRKTRKKRPVGI